MVIKRGFDNFIKEAERLYKKVTFDSKLGANSKPISKKNIRVNFNSKTKSIRHKLVYLYGEKAGKESFEKIESKMNNFIKKKSRKIKIKDGHFSIIDRFTQKDIVLITYPDSFYKKNETPLVTLDNFSKNIESSMNTIHILPFFPYSSDRGFSVLNFKKVKEEFGDWDDVRELSKRFNLMFDGVFNHVSKQSLWFRHFLKGSEVYANHFITFDNKNGISSDDLKKIIRPRTSDLLTEFKFKSTKTYVWSTFSDDQVDLNYKEPIVLLRIIDLIFRYINNGATLLRLDAVNYFWKELGTTCVHLRQTHVIVQLIRDILDITAPCVSIITETNVPHSKNISYLGNGKNEAQLIYNFTLPPLVLYTFYKGNAKYLKRWADRLDKVGKYCSYFNFLASHDGIGLTPAERVLPQKEVKFMVKKARANGAQVLNKHYKENEIRPYELNVTWWSALNGQSKDEDMEIKINRFIATHIIAISIKGVPVIYYHSLFGSENDNETYKTTGIKRDINRKNIDCVKFESELGSNTKTNKVFTLMNDLFKIRAKQKAFHPNADQLIIQKNDSVFSVLRTSIDKTEKVLVLVNVTDQNSEFTINCSDLKLNNHNLYDVINKKSLLPFKEHIKVNEFVITLKPYESLWIKSVHKVD